MHRTTRLGRVTLAAVTCVILASCAQPRATDYDLLIRNASVVDGTGASAYRANVLVKGDTIAAIDTQMRADATAARVIDANGRTLAPGFIDLHTHGDPIEKSFENFLAMGVTTVVVGQDGDSVGLEAAPAEVPFAQWAAAAEAAGVQVNVAALSGHGSIRHLAQIPDSARHLNAEQTARMRAVLRADLQAGTYGMSTGLEYVPGIYSEPEEVLELAREVGAAGGVVMSHMRSENDETINQSIDELAAQGAYARVHISHLKVVFGKGAERGRQLLAVIDSKRKAGIDLTADAYPYTAGYTGIAILFPEWALPPTDYKTVVAERRAELAAYLERRMTRRGGPGSDAVRQSALCREDVGRSCSRRGESRMSIS